ncbi:Hypothetical predicted protein [Xyrichtys novacula]|uniref:Uncharacterized protein n=1 Tax=Xyrichtys novacula TaxID=13765 RepID=A0AAV1FNG7_XYRNO|nr:Hypothetical predicted protein [Xyrichtys novacula]
MNLHDLSAPANRIAAPGMTAEPLSLSWPLSVETHTTHTNTQIPSCNINININSRWPLWIYLSVSLLAKRLDHTRRSDGLVT